MNQSVKYSPNGYYDIVAGNIRTINSNLVEIDHQLIIGDLPDDVSNADVITSDNLGRLHKLPKTSLPSGNPFDQDLNTTDDVLFNSVEVGVIPVGSVPTSTVKINSTHSHLTTYSDANIPQVNISKKTQFGNDSGSINIGCYEDEFGVMKMATGGGGGTAFSVFTTTSDVWIGSSKSDPLDPGTCEFVAGLNMRPSYTRWYTRCFLGDGLTPSAPLPAKLCALDGSINEVRPINIIDVFGQNLKTTDSPTFDGLTLTNPADGLTNTEYLTLGVGNVVEKRILPAFGTGDVNWIGGASVDNTVARYDSTTGLIIQGSGVVIDDSDNLSCTSLNTGQGANSLYPMNQDVLSTSNVNFNNVFVDNILQSDSLQEQSLNNGVDITSWNVQSQKIKSEALVSIPNPLTIELKYAGDSESALSLIAENHDNNGILFDMNHVDAVGTTNDYLSGSVNGNVFINKDAGDLNFLFQNGITKGLLVDKTAMTNTLSLSKTSINLNQTSTFGQSIVANNLTTDAELLDTVLITQNSGTNEITKRSYQSIYGTAVGTSIPLEITLPLDTWISPNLAYGMTLAKNCAPVGNTITIDAGIDSFIGSIDYALAYASDDNGAINYEFAIRVSSFIATGSLMTTILKNSDEIHNVSCHLVFPLNALDTIELVVKNPTGTKPITIYNMSLTINKVFQ